MTKTKPLLFLLLFSPLLACSSKSALKASAGADAGRDTADPGTGKDAWTVTPEDAKTTAPEVWVVPDLALAPDMATGTPDVPDSGLAPDAVASKPDVPDLGLAPDVIATRPETGKNDSTPFVTDAAPDLRQIDDSRFDDAGPVYKADGKTPPDASTDAANVETGNDLGAQGEVGIMVSGVEVIPYKDYGAADSTCVQNTASWIDSVTTYLAEDRRCFADSDCQYVSFSNSCGQVCPVPMNVQRIGEFAQHAIGDFDPKCSTCPVLTSYPICAAPPEDGSVICSNNVCVWK